MHRRTHLFGLVPLPTPFEALKLLAAGLAVQSALPSSAPASPPSREFPVATPSMPSLLPTVKPSTILPTRKPTIAPSFLPTKNPTNSPTNSPTPGFISLSGHSLSSCSIKPGEIAEIKIYGKFSDGSFKNITRDAIIESSNTEVIQVTQNYTDDGALILSGESSGWAELTYSVNNMYCRLPIYMTVWPQQGYFQPYAPDYRSYNP